jgi:hypothetical protein
MLLDRQHRSLEYALPDAREASRRWQNHTDRYGFPGRLDSALEDVFRPVFLGSIGRSGQNTFRCDS